MKGTSATTTQSSRETSEVVTQMSRRFRTRSTTATAGSWISAPSGGIAARSPITAFDAPSASA